MRCDKKDLLLYAVTDRSWVGRQTLVEQITDVLKGGGTMVQLREKEMDHDGFLAEAKVVQQLCRAYHAPFIINDDVDLAIEVGADGVHVGQSDMEAGDVRTRVGEGMLVGVSCRTVEEALAAQSHGADYLGVGAMFPTSTKLDACDVTYETLKAICMAVDIPVVAIGGISEKNIVQLKGSGIAGVAVVSALFGAADVQAATVRMAALAREAAQ